PATVVLSLLITFSWLATVLGMNALHAFFPLLAGRLAQVILLVASPILALPLTSIAIRPLAPFFVPRIAQGRKDLLGKVCVIRTGTADERFGEATLEDGGAGLVVRVRIDGEKPLARGQ